jgi:hypothetical protein
MRVPAQTKWISMTGILRQTEPAACRARIASVGTGALMAAADFGKRLASGEQTTTPWRAWDARISG